MSLPGAEMSLDMPQPSREAHVSVATLCAACHGPIPEGRRRGSERKHCSPACRRRAWDDANRPRRAARQAVLPGESRVERRFREWIETPAGRYVEAEVTRLALERRRAGRRRGEINLLCAIVRDQSFGLAKDGEGYAVNNSFRSLLARRLMEAHPELAGWFETRELRGVR